MAYPTNKQTIKKDWVNDTPVANDHPNEHNLVASIVEALQDKVGITNDTDVNSIDFKLSDIPAGEKAGTSTGTQTVQDNLDAHEANTANPHVVTKEQVGLGNVTNDAQVALTGDQTVTGVKTFSSSPIVPTPTEDNHAVNKAWVESAGKDSVGLYTQGKFIDTFTTNLKISAKQGVTATANTGMASVVQRIDTLDGVDFVASYGTNAEVNVYFYSKSGTVFTNTQSPYLTVSSANSNTSCIKLISGTSAVVTYEDGGTVYATYIQKSGTWTVTNTVSFASASVDQVHDIYLEDSNTIFISYRTPTSVKIKKLLIAGGNIVIDNTYSEVEISVSNPNSSCFNNSSEIFIGSSTSNTITKYSFVSGGTGTQIGNQLTGTSGYPARVISDDIVMIYIPSDTRTYEFDGTDFIIVSAGNDFIDLNQAAIISPTELQNDNEHFLLTGTGYENSIEDLNANGHLRYMSSLVQAGFGGMTLTLSGTVSDNGDYVTANTNSGSIDKVLLTTQPVAPKTILNAVVTTKFANNVTEAWVPKGSNYYLGQN